MTASSKEGDSLWTMLIPLLDEALLSLTEKDRVAVMLHFMEQRTFREVGKVLGVGEDAARKRVNRVVSDLISWFSKQGVVVPGTAMIATLSLQGVYAVPINAAAILSAGLATGTSQIIASTLSSLAILMTSTQIKITVALIALGIGLTTHFALRNRTVTTNNHPHANGQENETKGMQNEEPGFANAAPGFRVQVPIQPQLGAAPEKSFLERLNDGDMSLSMLSREEADNFFSRLTKQMPKAYSRRSE